MEGYQNATQNFVAIGMKVFDTMPLPPEIDSLGAFLTAMPSMLQMLSRNAVGVETHVGESSAIVINKSPYPDDLVYGELWGVAKRFTPNGNFSVMRVAEAGTDTFTEFEVKW